jgi:hypothetical protein
VPKKRPLRMISLRVDPELVHKADTIAKSLRLARLDGFPPADYYKSGRSPVLRLALKLGLQAIRETLHEQAAQRAAKRALKP